MTTDTLMIWFAMTAGYHPAAGMSVLGEIVERVSGVPYERYVRDRIFEPVGAPDCWMGMPEPRYEAYGDRIGYMHNTTGAEPVVLRRINSARSAATPMRGLRRHGLGRTWRSRPGEAGADRRSLRRPSRRRRCVGRGRGGSPLSADASG